MGNILSMGSTGGRNAFVDSTMSSETETMDDVSASLESNESEMVGEQFHDTISEDEDQVRAKVKKDEMTEFRRQLSLKREQRKEILARHRSEKKNLEKALEEEKKSKLEIMERNKALQELLHRNNIEIPLQLTSIQNSDIFEVINQMKAEFEMLKSNNNRLRCELANTNNALQIAYSDIADLSTQNTESIKQINALKEVIAVSKTMISLREQQLNQLKNKLTEIEQSLADRETNILSVDLRQEYERQLQNIRTLRGLYEERARLAESTRQALIRELEEQKLLKLAEIQKCKNLAENVEELETRVSSLESSIEDKNNEIASCQEETRGLQAEMAVVNKLFSQVLLGYKTKKDLDQLVQRLEENHGLLTHMAERENGSESSFALPKLLLELINQVDENENIAGAENIETLSKDTEISENKQDNNISNTETDKQSSINTKAEEIVQNLPKVWRVLMELLSQQSETDTNTTDKVTTCYKSVETKSGPVLVPSVSQTYIRLKDLIIEKLSLIKEVNRMKQLNAHLESRLGEQEKRLCLVTTELSKTWHVVGRLRRHHHQLHTHEKILKYELQQKRKLLNELKEELEYCREKWEQAREKNTQTERDWRKLRTEFSNRKVKPGSSSLNNSAESGYSDEKPSDESSESNDESEVITEPKVRCKKKLKKSFETVIDSSTDFNLVAEREDPASDMLDVADLPLDTQDEVPESFDVSYSEGESLLRSDKTCDETEDEIGNIANDSCTEDTSVAETKIDTETENCNPRSTSVSNTDLNPPVVIDPAAILRSIKEQNERLAKKDKKLECLEKDGKSLLQKTQTIAKYSDQINNALDHLLNRPTSSGRHNSDPESSESIDHLQENGEMLPNISLRSYESQTEPSMERVSVDLGSITSDEIDISMKISDDTNKPSCSSTPIVALDSANEEKKKLVNEDLRLCNSQNDYTVIPHSLKQPLATCNGAGYCPKSFQTEPGNSDTKLSLDTLEQQSDQTNSGNENGDNISGETSASTFDVTNHEARFAARDLRLKRLEEQTKSLVNKVNKTATKGVKINYKLEELHNIYGSDQSRSGTPSEESEDISQGKEDEKENDEQN